MHSKVFSSLTIHSFGSFHVIFYTLGFHFFAQNYHPTVRTKKVKGVTEANPRNKSTFFGQKRHEFCQKSGALEEKSATLGKLLREFCR